MKARYEMIVDLSNHFHEEETLARLCAHPPEVIARIHAFFHDEHGWTSPHRISAQQGNILLTVQMGFDTEHVTDALTYMPSLVEQIKGRTLKAVSLLRGYRKNGWIPVEPDLEPNPRALNVMLTTLGIITALDDRYKSTHPKGNYPLGTPIGEFDTISSGGLRNDYQMITDEALVRAIWEHPDRSEQIIETVRERGALDAGLILAVIGAPSALLSQGML
jgi:hypothetical protein